MTAWYEQLRQQYRPDQLQVLVIGESGMSCRSPATRVRRSCPARPSSAPAGPLLGAMGGMSQAIPPWAG
jgi:hypothetical protein